MQILYQDELLLVVNKPAGLLTIRDGYHPDLPTVKAQLEKEFGRCWIVHRLDKETSGVLLIARNENSHRLLNLSFQNHEIKKTYHAIIHGVPPEKKFVIVFPLEVDGDRKHRTIINTKIGKPARSTVTILQLFDHYSLVSIEPTTGYTHQIRAHLSASGFPILGDKLYLRCSSFEIHNDDSLIDRTALHSYKIEFTHPISQNKVTFQADYPEDFNNALSKLK